MDFPVSTIFDAVLRRKPRDRECGGHHPDLVHHRAIGAAGDGVLLQDGGRIAAEPRRDHHRRGSDSRRNRSPPPASAAAAWRTRSAIPAAISNGAAIRPTIERSGKRGRRNGFDRRTRERLGVVGSAAVGHHDDGLAAAHAGSLASACAGKRWPPVPPGRRARSSSCARHHSLAEPWTLAALELGPLARDREREAHRQRHREQR